LLGSATAIDAGITLPEIIDDLDGNARPEGAGYDKGAYEWMSVPKATIQANGSNGPLTVSLGSTVFLTLSLDPDRFSGQLSDWWVVQVAPTGLYYFDWGKQSLEKGLLPTHQGGLFALAGFPIMNLYNLDQGTHNFYFGVDLNMNGSLDMSSLYYDRVSVNVTGP